MRIEKTSAAFTTFARPVPFYFLEVKTNGKSAQLFDRTWVIMKLKIEDENFG